MRPRKSALKAMLNEGIDPTLRATKMSNTLQARVYAHQRVRETRTGVSVQRATQTGRSPRSENWMHEFEFQPQRIINFDCNGLGLKKSKA